MLLRKSGDDTWEARETEHGPPLQCDIADAETDVDAIHLAGCLAADWCNVGRLCQKPRGSES